MEQHNCLGIYLSQQKAVAVLLSGHGSSRTVLASCSVEKEDISQEQEQNFGKDLIEKLAKKTADNKFSFTDVAVALDCSLFTQHEIRSEFTDHKQIANTVRFDVEDAVAMDAMELAVAFNITGKDERGSNIAVYTAKKQILTEILTNFEDNGIDPTAMEPDVACLSRFMTETIPETKTGRHMLVNIGARSCYMIIPSDQGHAPKVRSFLISASQNVQNVLAREIALTLASHASQENTPSAVIITGQTDGIDTDKLSEACGYQVQTVDIIQASDADRSKIPAEVTDTDFAIAYGAAMEETAKTKKTDFREDFAPYAGKKRILEKNFKTISIALTIIFIAMGTFFQYQVSVINRQADERYEALSTDAKQLLGKTVIGRQGPVASLKSMYIRITSGGGRMAGDETSVPVRLTYLLEAINKTSKTIGLKISQIRVTNKTMELRGSTTDRNGAIALFEAIDKHEKLKKAGENITKDGFKITIESQ